MLDLILTILGKIGIVVLFLVVIAIAQYGIIMMLPRDKRERLVRDLLDIDWDSPIENLWAKILFNL